MAFDHAYFNKFCKLYAPKLIFFNPHQSVCLLILEREEGRERENINVRNLNWLLPICAPTEDGTHNILVYRTVLQPIEPPSQDAPQLVLTPLIKITKTFWVAHALQD